MKQTPHKTHDSQEPDQPIRIGGTILGDRRHICAFFKSHDDQYGVLLPFIKDGFSSGEKAVHIVNPMRRDELELCCHRLALVTLGEHVVLAFVHFRKHLGVQRLLLAQGLQGIEQARVRAVHFTPGDGHAPEIDVGGLALAPALEVRVEGIAVRAGVPEHFDDFDLAWRRIGGLRRHQRPVIRARDPLAGGQLARGGERRGAFQF